MALGDPNDPIRSEGMVGGEMLNGKTNREARELVSARFLPENKAWPMFDRTLNHLSTQTTDKQTNPKGKSMKEAVTVTIPKGTRCRSED